MKRVLPQSMSKWEASQGTYDRNLNIRRPKVKPKGSLFYFFAILNDVLFNHDMKQ